MRTFISTTILLCLVEAAPAQMTRPVEPMTTQVDLSSFERFPAAGMKVGETGFDGLGRAFDPNEFRTALFATSGALLVGRVVFTSPDETGLHLLCEKQSVPVRSQDPVYRVHFLGASGCGATSGNVHFVSNTGEQAYRLRFSEWLAAPTFGEAVALKFNHILDDGQRVERPASLFVQTVPLAKPAVLTQIRLPMNPDLRIFAITLDHRASGTPVGEMVQPEAVTPSPAIDLPRRSPRQPDGPAVGFVVHPHEAHFEDYTVGQARSMLSNAFAWRVVDPETCRIDTGFPALNLRYCYEHDLTMAPIIDNSLMIGGSTWVGRYARMKGEGILSAENRSWTWPSPYSPIYRREMQRYAEQVTKWVNANDPDRRVTAYLDGAEWFWQGSFDYSKPTLAAFRRSMHERYTNIDSLNASWGTQYASFDQIDAPRLFSSGTNGSRPVTFTIGPTWNDASWYRPMDRAIPCEPGQAFAAEVAVRIDKMLPIHVDFEGVWLDAANKVIGWQPCEIEPAGEPGFYRIRWTDSVPANAKHLWPHLKVKGPGTVRFEHLTVTRTKPDSTTMFDEGFGDAAQQGWQFSAWTGPGNGQVIPANGKHPAALQMSIPAPQLPYKNPTAAVVDYVEFTWEALADAINDQAAAIKKCDPSRPVASYLGFAWSIPVVWDNAITNHSVDVTAMRTKDLDILGMQLCSAKGDFHYATSTIDIARKYGKPMWATDLIDFTHGTYVGFDTLDQLTQACIQHGLDGVYWYCWFGTPDYNYYTGLPDEKVRELVHNAEDTIRELDGWTPIIRVALVNPIIPYWLGDPDGMKNDAFDAYGWQKMLGEMGVAVDLWTPYELEHAPANALAKYRVVVLPDAAFMPAQGISKIQEFVARTGGLINSGRAPQWESHGQAFPDRVLPGTESDSLAYDSPVGHEYLGKLKRFRVAGNTPPLFIEVEGQNEARAKSRAVQAQVHAFLKSHDVPLATDADEHRVEVSIHERGGETMLVLVRAESQPAPLTGVHVRIPASSVQVKADHGQWKPIAVTEGRVTLPDFRNVCLVRYSK